MHSAHYGHEVVEVMSTSEQTLPQTGLQPMPDATSDGTTAPQTIEAAPGTNLPGKSSTDPEAAPPAPEPKAEDYEKDPEPKTTSSETTETSATQKLVSGYRHQSNSYLDQLVRNASHSTEDGTTISE
ncbi:MAG: hypothetical protein U0936_24480 [Planctomycetaceae bacterium]